MLEKNRPYLVNGPRLPSATVGSGQGQRLVVEQGGRYVGAALVLLLSIPRYRRLGINHNYLHTHQTGALPGLSVGALTRLLIAATQGNRGVSFT